MALFALGLLFFTNPTQSFDLTKGAMPKLDVALILAIPRRTNYQVGHSSFQLAVQSGLPSRFRDGDAFAGSVWKKAEQNEDGMVFSNTGSSPIYAEWTEPVARKVLAQFIFGGSDIGGYIVDGVWQPSNKWGNLPLQLSPLNLKAGRHTAISGSALSFKLIPIQSKFVFNPMTALISDIRQGESKTYEGSITAINCTDDDQPILLNAQVGNGPIVTTKVPSLEVMNSRIVRFQFRAKRDQPSGSNKLKLWVKGDLPSFVDLNVVKAGEPFRRTYIGKADQAVHGYTVYPSLEGAKGKPMVAFMYGGNPEGSHIVAKEFKPPKGYSLIIPEIRGGTWSGVAGRDLLETLELAVKELEADRTRTYLYGHSMGGHGAYLIGSLNPPAFAGVGSSAGWVSLYTYLGEKHKNINDPIERIFELATEEQWVDRRFDALASIGNFAVVHGDKDGVVQLTETTAFQNEMEKRNAQVTIFERPGMEHFWEADGMNQYDFPPVLEKLISSSRRGSGVFMQATKMPRTWQDGTSKRVAIVYGTGGSKAETAATVEEARFEETMGREFFRMETKVVKDTIDPSELKGWNVTLIGNERTNSLWKLHPTASIILATAKKKGVSVDGWLIQAQKGRDTWSIIGGETLRSSIAVYQLYQNYYEYPFPEWTLFDSSRMVDGYGWVVGAGFNNGNVGWRSPSGTLGQ